MLCFDEEHRNEKLFLSQVPKTILKTKETKEAKSQIPA
jgi:hypothetical protein